jgi:hypothetical protein
MTEDAAAPARRSRRRRVWLVVLVLTLVFVLARAGLDLWAESRVDVEVARLEQRYGTLAEGSLRLQLLPAADNRARAVRAATALTVPGGDSDQQRSVSRFRTYQSSLPVPAELRAFVDANRAAIKVAEESRTRRQSNWDIEPSGFNTPPWLELRILSNAICLDALVDLEDGRPDDSANVITAGLAVSSSLRQERNLIAQLIRISITTEQIGGLQHLLVQAEPSKAMLAELSRWLVENRMQDPMREGLLSELKHGHAAMLKLESGRVDDLDGKPLSWLASPLARLGRPLIRMAHARYLQQVGALLDLQAGPRPRPEFASHTTPSRWSWMRRWDSTPTAGLVGAIESGDLFASELNAAELAVALRRFRLDRGAYPDELSALAPEYLASVPIDPFTGRPPVYARKGAGFELHADGPKNRTPRPAGLDWVVMR